MNYYERHIGDYLKDTSHLSLLEHGIYTRLLDVYYTREEPLPAAEVARLIGARSKEEREAMNTVLREFFVSDQEPPTAWLQQRCEREIARFKDKQSKARRSAETRWGAQRTQCERNANASCDDDANAMRTHSEGTANGMHRAPVPSNQTPDPIHNPPTPLGSPPPKPPKIDRPDDVAEAVWADWLALRRAKKAPVTGTVLARARAEAGKAGMSLESFLGVWCARGSQGLEAAWLRPDERRVNGHNTEPEWRRQQRERNVAVLGPFAAKRTATVIDVEATDAAVRLG